MNKTLGNILLAAVLFFAGFFTNAKFFSTPCPELVQSDTTTTISYDSAQHVVGKEDLEVSTARDSAAPSLPPRQHLSFNDSAAIADAFYAVHRRTTTFRDSNIAIKYSYNLSQNQAYNDTFRYSLLKPISLTQVNNIFRPAPSKLQVYGGVKAGQTFNRAYLAPTATFIANEKHLFGGSYNLLDPNFNFLLDYQFRIF